MSISADAPVEGASETTVTVVVTDETGVDLSSIESGDLAVTDPTGAALAATGRIEDWLDAAPALAVEDRVRAALADSRRTDADSGSTGVGAHRSDLQVRHGRTGRPASECSTGEQKALLIAIVLAAARVQAAERGSLPLLLLDEVAAHLDAGRRAALFEEIDAIGAQAWYTGTDRAVFAPLRDRAQSIDIDEAHAATVRAAASQG